MASAEHEPITGVWGQSPQRGPGAEPLVRASGGQSPPEAESILVIGCPTEPANLAPSQKCPFELRYTQQSLTKNSMLCYGPLVSELRGPRVHGAPNPVIGGGCAPPRLRRLCCIVTACRFPLPQGACVISFDVAVNWLRCGKYEKSVDVSQHHC